MYKIFTTFTRELGLVLLEQPIKMVLGLNHKARSGGKPVVASYISKTVFLLFRFSPCQSLVKGQCSVMPFV